MTEYLNFNNAIVGDEYTRCRYSLDNTIHIQADEENGIKESYDASAIDNTIFYQNNNVEGYYIFKASRGLWIYIGENPIPNFAGDV